MNNIKKFLNKYKLDDDQLKDYKKRTINEITKILEGNIHRINKSDLNSILYGYAGLYYEFEIKNFKLAEKYYSLSVGRENNDIAMLNLGSLYLDHAKYKLAEKYLLMAIKRNKKK